MGLIKFKKNNDDKSKLSNLTIDSKFNKENVIYENETLHSDGNKVSRLNDGTNKVIVSSKRNSYYDESESKWYDIDNTLIENDDAYINKRGKNKIEISKAERGNIISLSNAEYCIKWEFLGNQNDNSRKSKVNLNINNDMINHTNKATYENVDDFTDLQYILDKNNLKENIIVKSKKKDYRYPFKLTTEGLSLRLSCDNKSIELLKGEEVKAMIPSPYMYDNNGDMSGEVFYELEQLNNHSYTFTIIADEEWINSEERHFPVVIDPQIVIPNKNPIDFTVYRYVTSQWMEVTEENNIQVSNDSTCKYKTVLHIDKSLFPSFVGELAKAELILTPISDFQGNIYDGTKNNFYNSKSGVLNIDITEKVISKTSRFDITLTTSDNVIASFSGVNNPPYIELSYLANENDIPCKKVVNLSDIAIGDVNLKTGEMVITCCDVEPDYSVMGLGIYHVYKKGIDNFNVGNNFQLNINEKFVRYSDDTFIYTDSQGVKHGFRQYFYYLDSSKNKKYVEKSDVIVDSSGNLEIINGSKKYKVFYEYKSSNGLTALTTLEEIKNISSYEQRQSRIKELENQISSYKQALVAYNIWNVPVDAPENDVNIGYEDFSVVEDCFMEHILDDKNKVENFLKQGRYEHQYPLTETQIIEYQRMYFEITRLTKEQILMQYDIEEQQAFLEGKQNNNATEEEIDYWRTLVNTLIRKKELLSKTIDYYNFKIDEFVEMTSDTLDLIERYYKEYCTLSDELEREKHATPTNYLTDGKIFKGYNEFGDLVALFDLYGNEIIVEYEKQLISEYDFAYRVSRIYDNNKKYVLFEYENYLLSNIINTKGRKTSFIYEDGNLKKIINSSGKTLELNYLNDNISSITNNEAQLYTYINYTNDKVSNIDDYSLINEIPKTSVVEMPKTISTTTFTYEIKTVSPYNVIKTTISYMDHDEIYEFNDFGFNELYMLVQNGNVTKAERYSYTPYYIGQTVQSNPHKKIVKANKELLYTSLSSFNFVDGDTEETILNQFNNPLTTTIGPIDIANWVDSNGVTQTNSVTIIIDYEYDNNQKLIKETKNVSYNNPNEEYTVIKTYDYNLMGDIVRVTEYVEGEELTKGINISESVFDERGNLFKSYSYNTLDASSKFYNESKINEYGLVSLEYDSIKENSVINQYLNNSSLISEKKLPNGSRIGYGYDLQDRLSSITQSTLEGEESSTQKKYMYGSLLEVNSNINNIKYTYDYHRNPTSISLDGIDNYATLSQSYSIDYNGKITEYISSVKYKNRQPILTITDVNGKFLKKAINSTGGVYLENIYTKGKLTSSVDSYNAKTYIIYRDDYDRITRIYSDSVYNEARTYNQKGLLTRKIINGIIYNYTYKENYTNDLDSLTIANLTIKPYFDNLCRYIGKEIVNGATTKEKVSYYKIGDHTTNLVSSITYDNKDKIRYSYDNMGNISNVYDNDELAVRYVYDGLNRLVREDNKYFSKTVLYSYDNNGNILKKREFNFTLKEYIELEELDSTDSVYEYENDRLLKYNDKTCTYNTDGRITNYLGNNLTWNMFDYLSKIGSNSFEYDSYGRRTKKNNTTFVYDSSNNLIQAGSMEFLYDITGLCGLTYNGNTYTYRKNALGDIIALVDTNGTIVVKYIYNAWGSHVVVDENGTEITDSTHIGNLNPFRYRGYYYDVETQLYWVSSRYYSPELCRWISPDSIEYLDPESINGLNLYCYCHNNPIMYVDPDGHMPKWAQWVVGGLAIAGLVVATVLTCGVAGAGAAAVGATMLAGGLVSAGINVVDQLSDGGEFNWTELAISTLSGTAYGLVVGLTGGAGGWAVAGKFAVAGGTSLLNSWNQNATFGETMKSLEISLLVSGAAQGAGYLAGKFGPQLLSKIAPRNPNHWLTMGDIGSALWAIPAVKTGVIRFVGGVAGSVINNF